MPDGSLFDMRQTRRRRVLGNLNRLLTAEDVALWRDAPQLLMRDLSEDEITCLAISALRALPDDMAVQAALWAVGETDLPLPTMLAEPTPKEVLTESRDWASQASQRSLKAMAMACVERMPPSTRAGFRKWEGRK